MLPIMLWATGIAASVVVFVSALLEFALASEDEHLPRMMTNGFVVVWLAVFWVGFLGSLVHEAKESLKPVQVEVTDVIID